MTFVASANAVEHTGAQPVFVDGGLETGLIDRNAAEHAITSRTKAIMPVHLGGRPIDMERLNEIRDRHGIAVIENAAHAISPDRQLRHVTAFSFYVTKNIKIND